jgi:glycosyltransferase involved in cell wall biosynthesis
MNYPLVSILIPLYNAEKYIATTIESALAQTWPNKEIIVVDDGSQDNGVAIAKQFVNKGVQVYEQPNTGAAAARNMAFQLSKGVFIQYLDADDLLGPDKIEAQLTYAKCREDVVISGQWRRFAHTIDNPIGEWGPHESIRKDLAPIDWLIQTHMMQTCAWLTPRKLIKKTGGWNETLRPNPNDDGEFFMRIVANCSKVLFCPQSHIYYRTENLGTLASLRSESACRSLLATCDTFHRTVLSLEDSSRTRLAVANNYMDFAYTIYPRYTYLVKQAQAMAHKLGGSSRYPPGSPVYRKVSTIIGWKFASRLWRSLGK